MVGIVDRQVDPFVRHLFAGSGYLLGEFTCAPGAPRWRHENWIGDRAHVVLPSTPVCIIAAGHDPLVSTANEALLYDPDVSYRRRVVGGAGDRCVFFELTDELADELRVGGRRPRPALRHGPLAAAAYAEHRVLRAALRDPRADPAAVDERAHAVIAAAARAAGAPVRPPPAGWRHAVEDVKSALAAAPTRPWTLADVAALVHYSPFALARAFRRATGYTVHQFRQQLRLRASLDGVLAPSTTLADVAMAAGFSSHSHYTLAFRRAFGMTPTRLRAGAFPAAGQVPAT